MMKRSLLATCLLALSLPALGCGTEGGPARLEVQMLSISGALDGRALDPTAYTTASGERFGDQGTFFLVGETVSMQLAACPLDDLHVDPYGEGEGGERPIPVDAGAPGEVPTIGSTDCLGRGLQICDAEGCGSFPAENVDIEIVEANGWRRVVFDASGLEGDARVELLYRERR